MGITIVIGDLHGDLGALNRLWRDLPDLTADDSVVFLGDYLDRGPRIRQTVAFVRTLPERTAARVVALRGNHEDAWLRVVDRGWPGFLLPRGNGCLESLRSFRRQPHPRRNENPTAEEIKAMERGSFLPRDVVAWMRDLPLWHEDEHGLYVHAGIPRQGGHFPHPSRVRPQSALMWIRTRDFFTNYEGKYVVFGHTRTTQLPQELSRYTPDDDSDAYAGRYVAGIDTGAGKRGGFLTALELPRRRVYESRRVR